MASSEGLHAASLGRPSTWCATICATVEGGSATAPMQTAVTSVARSTAESPQTHASVRRRRVRRPRSSVDERSWTTEFVAEIAGAMVAASLRPIGSNTRSDRAVTVRTTWSQVRRSRVKKPGTRSTSGTGGQDGTSRQARHRPDRATWAGSSAKSRSRASRSTTRSSRSPGRSTIRPQSRHFACRCDGRVASRARW